ncbi:HPr kinase/phosphorylase [Litchfieldia alkalitelluris]|uniref:HPr kinase/phosphorylase n=1 Tax=Litchfieldia alkalitelluris TaxID=304268 RepID=UPI000996DA2A|nr:aldolase [Litchfieldia alkalitelluris]
METVTKYSYRAFGLNIVSDIQIEELQKTTIPDSESNIFIELGDLSMVWEESIKTTEYFVIKEDYIFVHIPKVAIFKIQKGNNIIVSPISPIKMDAIRLYLLGTCMGSILIQRGILPLHGSAIEVNGKAYAIVGDSGAGKSTLASAFLRRGFRLISDDVIPVSLSKDNIPMVTPAYPQQKLWQESLTEFGIESTNLRPIIDRETKFAIPVPNQFVNQQLPLAGIFELVKTNNEEIVIKEVKNLERLQKLFYHTYRNFLIEHAGLLEWHFSFITRLLNDIKIYQIKRPVSYFTAHNITTLILQTIEQEVEVSYDI